MTVDTKISPFLKWAGGKRWLVHARPDLFDKNYNRYFEPFLGGGAVFFALQPQIAFLSDVNEDLIECYQAVRDDWQGMVQQLRQHHKLHSSEYYYQIRAKEFRSPTKRAAKFLYLNRTCFNGLYRVNLKGEFNVPIGTKTNVLGSDDFEKLSASLQFAEIKCSDFEATLTEATRDDLVFVDPPYTVHHNNNGFLKYNQKLFSWGDQIRLRDCVADAVGRGARVVVSNASHQSVLELYEGIGEIQRISRASVMSGNNSGRGYQEEICVVC